MGRRQRRKPRIKVAEVKKAERRRKVRHPNPMSKLGTSGIATKKSKEENGNFESGYEASRNAGG